MQKFAQAMAKFKEDWNAEHSPAEWKWQDAELEDQYNEFMEAQA
jgi:hypothetical protein